MARIQPREQPKRHADHHRDDQRRKRQLQRGRQALQDQLDGRFVVDEALAQIAVQRAVQEGEVLLPQRLVETQLGNDAGAVDLVYVLADQNVDRVADGVQADEDDHRHHQHDQQRLADAAE